MGFGKADAIITGPVPIAPPDFLYGTAWKEDETTRLVALALKAGFRGIDTANQRKHYVEAGVGEAIDTTLSLGKLKRDELFIQTKFTFVDGQDERLPYDPQAPIAQQVVQSFHSSLEHLRCGWIDSYVLHGPMTHSGWFSEDEEAWGAMSILKKGKQARFLGISNVNPIQLKKLWDGAEVKPDFVQNRCYAKHGWDREVRDFCREHGIRYQGFSLLTANPQVLRSPVVEKLAARHKRKPAGVVFRYALQVGMMPLTGTKDPVHMRDDLDALHFALEPDEVAQVDALI